MKKYQIMAICVILCPFVAGCATNKGAFAVSIAPMAITIHDETGQFTKDDFINLFEYWFGVPWDKEEREKQKLDKLKKNGLLGESKESTYFMKWPPPIPMKNIQ